MQTPRENFVVRDIDDGQRLDNFLIKILKGVPKSHVYRIVRKGEVRVNSKRVKPDYRLQEGDILRIPPVRLTEKVEHKPSPTWVKTLEKRIIYEDPDLLILNKPAGLAVHGGSGINMGVIEIMRAARPKAKFLELAHRLDRDTSGCLILAKKPSILKELHALLREDGMEKRYLALVKGHWPKRVTRVDAALQKNQLRSGERIVRVDASGKLALTEFKIVERFGEATLVEATLRTGRTHQIRVHTAHQGHPIAGDDKYGDKEFNQWWYSHGKKRLFLHAKSVKFKLSPERQLIAVESPLDTELTECLEQLK